MGLFAWSIEHPVNHTRLAEQPSSFEACLPMSRATSTTGICALATALHWLRMLPTPSPLAEKKFQHFCENACALHARSRREASSSLKPPTPSFTGHAHAYRLRASPYSRVFRTIVGLLCRWPLFPRPRSRLRAISRSQSMSQSAVGARVQFVGCFLHSRDRHSGLRAFLRRLP